MDKIETINFHEVKEVAGIKFWCYHAGHVLGAAMFMIEIAGVKVMTPFLFVCLFVLGGLLLLGFFLRVQLMQNVSLHIFPFRSCCTQETSLDKKTDT